MDRLGATGVLGKAIGADNVIDIFFRWKELNGISVNIRKIIQTQHESGDSFNKDFEKIEKLLKQSRILRITKILAFLLGQRR